MTERDRAFDGLQADREIIAKGRALAWGNLGDKEGQDPQVEEILDVLMWEYTYVLSEGEIWHSLKQIILAQRFEEDGEACTAAIGFFKTEMSARKFVLEFTEPLNINLNGDRDKVERDIKACESTIRLLDAIRNDAVCLSQMLTPEGNDNSWMFGKPASVPLSLFFHRDRN